MVICRDVDEPGSVMWSKVSQKVEKTDIASKYRICGIRNSADKPYAGQEQRLSHREWMHGQSRGRRGRGTNWGSRVIYIHSMCEIES